MNLLYWDEWNWGNVPAWLGAVSLLLAFRIFMRDRGNLERKQVEQLGVWFDIECTVKAPWSEDPIEPARIIAHIRNASDLPVEVAQLAYEIDTRWSVADRTNWTPPDPGEEPNFPGVWVVGNGVRVQKVFVEEFRVPPHETVDSSHVDHLGNMAPVDARQLSFPNGVKCSTSWMLVIDNAGRRWELHPGKGGRARRFRRYSLHRDFYPANWGRRPVTIETVKAYFKGRHGK